jgi:hypothetical protein
MWDPAAVAAMYAMQQQQAAAGTNLMDAYADGLDE